MKLSEIASDHEDDEFPDFPTAKLKDLTPYAHHGKFTISKQECDNLSDDRFSELVDEMEGSDILMWHDWVDNDVVIDVSTKTRQKLHIAVKILSEYLKYKKARFAYCASNDLTRAVWRDDIDEIR